MVPHRYDGPVADLPLVQRRPTVVEATNHAAAKSLLELGRVVQPAELGVSLHGLLLQGVESRRIVLQIFNL